MCYVCNCSQASKRIKNQTKEGKCHDARGAVTRSNGRLKWETTTLVHKDALTPIGICGINYHPLANSRGISGCPRSRVSKST